ncbi:hypothetical protein [Archangium sp.]|uniref:hypothetical protein n=1 Tax=Archangium sp. TaxID=1872627 RepID=UPI00389A1B6C
MKSRFRLPLPLCCLGGLLLGSTALGQQDPRVVVVKPSTAVKAGGVRPSTAQAQRTAPVAKRYWADYAGNAIRRSDLDGSNVETLATDTSGPYGTTYDPETGKVLWTSSGDELVHMASSDGTALSGYVTLNSSFEEYSAIVVKGSESNVSYGVVDAQLVKVTEDRNTGTERRDVLLKLASPDEVHGLALAPDNSALYLGDPDGRMTRKLNLTTLQVQQLVYDNGGSCTTCAMAAPAPKPAAKPLPSSQEKRR